MNLNMNNTARYRVYSLRPDRRFVGGFKDKADAVSAAEEQAGEYGAEVWIDTPERTAIVGRMERIGNRGRFRRSGVLSVESVG